MSKLTDEFRKRTGSENSKDKLVTFIYILVRDHIPMGKIESIMQEHVNDKEALFTNGYLARYSKDVAKRLK